MPAQPRSVRHGVEAPTALVPPRLAGCKDAVPAVLGANAFTNNGSALSLTAACISGASTGPIYRVMLFSFTPTVNGTLTFDTCSGTSLDTIINVYSTSAAACNLQLASVPPGGCSDDACGVTAYQSRAAVTGVAGSPLVVAVGVYSSTLDVGSGVLTIS